MEIHKRRQKLSHELGIISQLVYKHCSAHRGTKYFQALKKVDRHMYEFSKLKVFDIPTCDSSENGKYRKRRAVSLLEEVEGNCIEVIERCLAELALGFFIPFHSLVIATISNLFTHAKPIKSEIQSSLKSGSAHDKRLRSQPALCTHRKIEVDLGVKIPRNEASKSKLKRKSNSPLPVTHKAKITCAEPADRYEIDLGIPVSRKALEQSNHNTAGSCTVQDLATSTHVRRNAANWGIKDRTCASVTTEKHPTDISSDARRQNKITVAENSNEPGVEASIMHAKTPAPTLNPANSKDILAVEERRPILDPVKTIIVDTVLETDPLADTKWSDINNETINCGTRHKSRELKMRSYRNVPLSLKRYHFRFLLHCHRKNIS